MIYDDNNPDVQLEQTLAEPTERSETQQAIVPVQAQPTQEENSLAKNIRALREKAERLERERDEAIRYAQQFQQQPLQQSPVEDDEIFLKPDELAEGKHLSKVQKQVKKLEQQLKQYEQRSTEMTAEARLKAQYPDFDKVVSKDNIEMLRMTYPEIAATLQSSPDLYNKAVSAYTMIKKLGIEPQQDLYEKDREMAQRNANKPKPLASLSPQQGESPMSRANAFANGLTDDVKKQLYKEMMELRKGY